MIIGQATIHDVPELLELLNQWRAVFEESLGH